MREGIMNVKEAVIKAKEYVSDLFADEQLLNIGLEELRREGDDWLVTIGFSRPWNRKDLMSSIRGESPLQRAYKVVRIRDDDGAMVSITDRQHEGA